MQPLDIPHRYRQLQRATVARSALDVIALIFLCAGFAFWGVAFWQLLTPPALLSLLSTQAVVLALVFSLAAPLLLSMLIPTTPAGQLLQKTQWRTIGFPVIIACAFFLTYQAEYLIELWLSAQPAINEANYARPLAISLVIAFVVVPALAWIQLTPERWLEQIQQAHNVRKLEIMQRGELAIIKARLVRAKQLAALEYANLLPLEQKEVIDTMRALFMSIGDTQRSIAGELGISANLERTLMDDAQIADHFDRVADALTVDTVTVREAAPQIDAPSPSERAKVAQDTRVAVRQGDAARDGDYTVAYQAFGRDQAWTVRDLAGVLKVAESTARERKIAWEQANLISGRGLSNGRYRFVESGT